MSRGEMEKDQGMPSPVCLETSSLMNGSTPQPTEPKWHLFTVNLQTSWRKKIFGKIFSLRFSPPCSSVVEFLKTHQDVTWLSAKCDSALLHTH